jgi:hypothetical protein
MRATIVEGEDLPAIVDDKDRRRAAMDYEPPPRLELLKAAREQEFFRRHVHGL